MHVNSLKNLLSIDLQYFPCINAISDIVNADGVCFNVSLGFKKSSFRNRLVLPGANGIVALSIPLDGGRSVKLPYDEVRIDYSFCWQRDHFRTLESIYGNSPYFFQYKNELNEIYHRQIKLLVDWNLSCLNWFFSKIKVDPPIFVDSIQQKEPLMIRERNDFYLPSNHKSPDRGPFEKYPQTFEDKIGFQPNMSVLDMLFNLGPRAFNNLKKIN